MKMIILPVIWYTTAISTFLGTAILARRALGPLIASVAAWPISIVAALALGRVAVAIRPDLRFSTKKQIDGLGYIHQPMDVVVYMTMLLILVAIMASSKK